TPAPTLFPYTTLFRSSDTPDQPARQDPLAADRICRSRDSAAAATRVIRDDLKPDAIAAILRLHRVAVTRRAADLPTGSAGVAARSEEHTSELQSRFDL